MPFACLGKSDALVFCSLSTDSDSERKKAHDRVYPKGYPEMLEQQQGQLVSGLQDMYRRLIEAQAWTGPKLDEVNGAPLTHNILAALSLPKSKHDDSGDFVMFEDDCTELPSKLPARSASYVHEKHPLSFESEHSQHSNESRPLSSGTVFPHPQISTERFHFTGGASSPPLSQSPVRRAEPAFSPAEPSPLQHPLSPTASDPKLFQLGLALSLIHISEPTRRS